LKRNLFDERDGLLSLDATGSAPSWWLLLSSSTILGFGYREVIAEQDLEVRKSIRRGDCILLSSDCLAQMLHVESSWKEGGRGDNLLTTGFIAMECPEKNSRCHVTNCLALLARVDCGSRAITNYS
jgi:hypothetical protein